MPPSPRWTCSTTASTAWSCRLRPGSPLLSADAPPGWTDRVEPAEACLALPLPADFDALRGQVSAKTLRDLRTARRRAAEAGAAWEEARPDTLDALLDALFRLHAARWQARGEAGVLDAAEVQAAHREAAPTLLRTGLLRLLALRLGAEIVAVLYGLADLPGRPSRRLHLYIAGFDPAHERLSPGMLLVAEAIERAIAEGISVVDFLRGEERYKSYWGARPEPTFRRVLMPCARC